MSRDIKSMYPEQVKELVLEKGYIIAGKDGRWLSAVSDIAPGDLIKLKFRDGSAECSVISTEVSNG